MTNLIGFGELLFLQNGHNYTDNLFRMRASVQHWLYSTLIYASGLFVRVDQAQPLHHPDAQLPRENAGFPLPQQLADLTLAEVEDLVPVIAPILIPIFGALGVLRYPTKPVSMAVQVATVSSSNICLPARKSTHVIRVHDSRNLERLDATSIHDHQN